jgi:hypothetical protein
MEEWAPFLWIANASVLEAAAALLVLLVLSFGLGYLLRTRTFGSIKTTSVEEGQEGLIVSAIMAVVGLLIGFTFSLSVQRFEERRMLVVTEANAIGTAYLRAQLLDEPDRTRLSNLLVAYTDNRIALAGMRKGSKPLLDKNDGLLTQIWAAVSAASKTQRGQTISTPLLFAFNDLIDHDTLRKAARVTQIPGLVMAMLYVFLIAAAAIVGFVLSGRRQRMIAIVMLLLLTFAISIIVDLNSPTSGSIRESQQPMLLTKQLLSQPRSDFDQHNESITSADH